MYPRLLFTTMARSAETLPECPPLRRTREVRLPPSRAKRASASLAVAFGGGGKPDTTYYRYMKTAVSRVVRGD
jgi:hypothetical protein